MLYTRTGDKGKSMLYNGEIREKSDMIFEALGSTDELNAHLGLAREYCLTSENGLDEILAECQSRLLDIGACIATPIQHEKTTDIKLNKTRFSGAHVLAMEDYTDDIDARCSPLTTFILPSGGITSCTLHVARTVCRRAERQVVPLIQMGDCDEEVGKYLNRLSDFLFAAARYAAQHDGGTETEWKKE